MIGFIGIGALLLTTQFDLGKFGLNSVDEIGYVNLSVLHHKSGDQVILHDVRKSPPSRDPAVVPEHRDPAPQSTRFVVSHFDKGNRNELKGFFNSFRLAPAITNLWINSNKNLGNSLAFSYVMPEKTFAGFWVHLFDSRKSPSERVYFDASQYDSITFAIRGEKGKESFSLNVMDHKLEAKEDSKRIGLLEEFLPKGEITTDWQTVTVPLSRIASTVDRQNLAGLVFEVTYRQRSGKIFVKDLAFSRATGQIAVEKSTEIVKPSKHGRSMWVWETERIQSNKLEISKLVAFCRQLHLTEVFIQIPYEATQENGTWKIEWSEDKMRPLLKALNKSGIKVHALDGDKSYSLEENHGRQLALVERIIKYNSRVPRDEVFKGIRFDNEPYLLSNFYGANKEKIFSEFVDLLKKTKELTTRAGLDFGVDIPFWYDQRNDFGEWAAPYGDGPVIESILEVVDNIGVMDYRTMAYGADGIIAHGEGELIEAEKRKKRVFVGLETVPLPDETIYEFKKNAPSVKALSLTQTSDGKVELTFPSEKNSKDGQPRLGLWHTTEVSGSKSTFHDLSKEDLKQAIEQTEKELGSYKSFAGIVLHSYESLALKLDSRKQELSTTR